MKHAIAELEIALHTAVTNEPVHRAGGNAGQADLCAKRAREFEDVISLLKAFDHLKDRGWFTPKPEPEQPRTIRQWLETLPDGYRERALANMVDDVRGDREVGDLASALTSAFYWYDAPEGHDFWSTIRRGEGFPPLPDPA